ncbi:MAG: AraC family transcriptional regulator [Oscillospiraceae bacterium]|nr:AraC family transcriptional regulator [Oscillospiraceae bacterium]
MTEHLHYYPDDEKILSFRPRVVFSGILNAGEAWSGKVHSHNFCEIMYITSGTAVIFIENEQYKVKTGDIIIYNSGVFHEEKSSDKDFSVLFFAIDNLHIPGLSEGCIVPIDANPVIEAGSYDDMLKAILSLMLDELTLKKAHYKAISTNIATMFCYYILRLYDVKIENPRHVEICNDAMKYIEENYKSDVSLDTIASSVHLSKYHFVRIFKETLGISPMKCLLRVRLAEAKNLLGGSDLSIKDVAMAVGYENALTFSRVFRNSENISPTDYRKNVQGFSLN